MTSDHISALYSEYFDPISKAPVVWRSLNPQSGRMFYRINFRRKLNIKSVRFHHGSTSETPARWRMCFINEVNGFVIPSGHEGPYIETGDPETRHGTSAIIVDLRQPIRAESIQVEMVESRAGEHWRVEAVLLRVKILWGLRSHIIGRFSLEGWS